MKCPEALLGQTDALLCVVHSQTADVILLSATGIISCQQFFVSRHWKLAAS